MLDISQKPFGTLDGRPVSLFTLSRPDGIRVSVSDYGCTIQSILVPDGDGWQQVVLGYDTLDEYRRGTQMFGATVGPIADLVRGASFTLDGESVCWEKNAGNDCIHSGGAGFHRRLWESELTSEALILHRDFPAGDFGYPDVLHAAVTVSLPAPDTLQLDYRLSSGRPFAASVTNHSYFRLNPDADISGQYLEVNSTCREPFDFSVFRPLSDALTCGAPQIVQAGGVDHFYPVRGEGLRTAARLYCPQTRLLLTCMTDAPGVLVYTANATGQTAGHGGEVYPLHAAVCLETEAIPNAVNLPEYRRQAVRAGGETCAACTRFSFRRCTLPLPETK